MKATTRLFLALTTYSRKAGSVMHDGPPWSISVVTPECTPARSASRPNRPVTCWKTWPCVSIRPGRTSLPATFTTSLAEDARMLAATAAILPSWMATSNRPSMFCTGSITRPPRSSRSYCMLVSEKLLSG